MRTPSVLAVWLLVASLAACGDAGTSSGDAAVTTLPDGAPCAAGEIYCGGMVCIPASGRISCGACGHSCTSAQRCQLIGAAYACVTAP